MLKILSAYICWKKIYKMEHLEGSGMLVLYMGRTILNPQATNVIYIYMEHPFLMFLDHTQRRTTVGMTPLDE